MNIKSSLKSLGLAILCSLVIVACDSLDDDFETLNVNPTQANDIDPNFKLTNIQLRISGERYENWRTNLIYSSTMMQHFAALPGYWSGDKYLYNAGYSASMWDRYYPNISKNIEDLLIQTSENTDDSNLYHITQVTRVIMYHRLTTSMGTFLTRKQAKDSRKASLNLNMTRRSLSITTCSQSSKKQHWHLMPLKLLLGLETCYMAEMLSSGESLLIQ